MYAYGRRKFGSSRIGEFTKPTTARTSAGAFDTRPITESNLNLRAASRRRVTCSGVPGGGLWPVAFQPMDIAVITGAFTLGGVVIGGGLDWVRASLTARRAAAGERDELIAAIDSACIALMTETLTWRALDTGKLKLRQLAFGMLEAGLPELPAKATPKTSAVDLGYTLVGWLGRGAAKSLRHQTPVALTDTLRSTMWPLRSEISVMAVRLSMTGDEEIKAATVRLGDAAGALIEHITEPDPGYRKRQEELRAAIGQLRRARDAADAPLWRRRRLRRNIRPALPPAA